MDKKAVKNSKSTKLFSSEEIKQARDATDFMANLLQSSTGRRR